MKLRTILFLASVLGLVWLTSAVAQDSPEQWGEVVAPGIEYREYDLPDPNNVFVARMERANPDVILESSIAQGQLVSGRESVSGMAARYDDAINFWGQSYEEPRPWGLRNDVVVAINGSYFDWYSGVPQSGQIHSGWYAKRFDNLAGGSGFVWKLDRSAFIGGCVNHEEAKQVILFANMTSQNIDGINKERNNDELVIYTPQYDSYTPKTEDNGVEVLVEMTRPTLILPEPAYALGYVRAVLSGKGATMIPFDYIVLSANGSAAEELQINAVPGTEIQISQEITHYDEGCSPPLSLNGWTKSYASIGGDFIFLKDGEIQTFDNPGATERHPRTAIAYNDDYIYFIVVDGRDVRDSRGMTIQELAEFTLDESIQATWAIAQDGGGSSTMVVNGEVKNNTFCNNVYCKYYVFLPAIPANGKGEQPISRTYQRWVANGMMMVVVQPAIHSDVFTPGETVSTARSTSLRLGPGFNYESMAAIQQDTSGTILDHMSGLNGIWAKGVFWWKVAFPNAVGWVAQNDIEAENSLTDGLGWSPR